VKRAFSLIEVIVVLGIMATLLAVTGLTLMGRVQQSGARGLAYAVASELRAARSEAQRTGALTALCFPTDGRKTPVSRSFLFREGSEAGVAGKMRVFDKDHNAGIFIGNWPTAVTDSAPAPPADWLASSADNYVVFFRPDGTSFTNGLPLVDNRFPLVVASEMRTMPGPSFFNLTAATDPYTVWVERSGGVTVEERRVPGPQLPRGGALICAAVPTISEKRDNAPEIKNIQFLPSSNPALDKVGLAQTYIEIHPEQKIGEDLEYGLATLVFEAEDDDGGPLFYRTVSTASSGPEGRFTLAENEGAMTYVNGKWRASVSWRPPPGAPTDTEYEFEIEVRDRDGHKATATSGAGLLPSLVSLAPSRVALEAADDKVYVGNVDGGDLVRITPVGTNDHDPFFSPDGTKLYTFTFEAGQVILNLQNSDGTGRKVIKDVPGTKGSIRFDPLWMWGAYTHSSWQLIAEYDEPDPSTSPETMRRVVVKQPVNSLEVLHLSSGKSFRVSNQAVGTLKWDAVERFGFTYTVAKKVDPPAAPGIELKTGGYKLVGFPPSVIPATLGETPDSIAYNLRDPSLWVRYDPPTRKLFLENASGSSELLATGPDIIGLPAWSSNGRRITWLQRSGASSYDIWIHELYDDALNRLTGSSAEKILSGSSLASPLLSPEGNYVFYLNGNHLWRMKAVKDGSAVKLSAKLPGVRSFALTR